MEFFDDGIHLDIIPVIDLMHGRVVHAKRGERDRYEPVASSLCSSSAPLEVVDALLALHAFKRLYIADLDAIRRHGNHRLLVEAIRLRYPQLDIWLDAGFGGVNDLALWQALEVACVVGSESLQDIESYLQLRDHNNQQAILSLDFTTQGYQGPQALLHNAELWPATVIAMTLAQVGSDAGPDLQTLSRIRKAAAGRLYAAGGVRGIEDIRALQESGIDGVLVASALHAGNLTRAEMATLDAC